MGFELYTIGGKSGEVVIMTTLFIYWYSIEMRLFFQSIFFYVYIIKWRWMIKTIDLSEGRIWMNITFFIGNGFDLNIGLETEYSNFYPYFIKNASEDNMIKKWISDKESQWSDLERKLGLEIKRVSESELRRFLEDKFELDELLSKYLEQQEALISDNGAHFMVDEFSRSLREYDIGYPEGFSGEISTIKKKYANERFHFQFICFNYTRVLDRIVECAKKEGPLSSHYPANGTALKDYYGEVIHIHGTTESDMVLGVNDIDQIGNEILKTNLDLQLSIIKKTINEKSRNNMINRAMRIISNSHIILIYGMSMGETDNMWWDILIDWLEDANNRLVLYYYFEDAAMIKRSAAKKNIENKKIIDRLLGRKKLSRKVYDSMESRILVMIESNIFCFKSMNKIEQIRE